MKFINNNETEKVRTIEPSGRFKWVTLKKGETIDLPEKVGKSYGFEEFKEPVEKTTEATIGKKKVSTKQLKSPKKK